MSKVRVFSLLIIGSIFLLANSGSVLAGYIISKTDREAVKQGWAKLTIPSGDNEPVGEPCSIRIPSETEISSLVSFCKSNETGWPFSPSECENTVRLLAQRSCDKFNNPKPSQELTPRTTLTITYAPPIISPAITNASNAATYSTNNKTIGDMTFKELLTLIKQIVFSVFRR